MGLIILRKLWRDAIIDNYNWTGAAMSRWLWRIKRPYRPNGVSGTVLGNGLIPIHPAVMHAGNYRFNLNMVGNLYVGFPYSHADFPAEEIALYQWSK